MMEPRLEEQLFKLERSLRRARLLRDLTFYWAVAALVGLFFVLVHRLTGWNSPVVWPLIIVVVLIAIWRKYLLYKTRSADYRALVGALQTDYPELKDLLSAAIDQKPDPESGHFSFLQLRVIDEALAHRQRYLWEIGLEQRLLYARSEHIVSLVVFAAILLVLARSAPVWHLTADGLVVDGVKVSPGDVTVEKGTGLVISARFSGKPPAEATLVVLPANGTAQRLPLTRQLSDPVFGTSLTEVNADAKYYIEYESQQTPDFKITTFEYPALVTADATLDYPSYTGLNDQSIKDTRRVSAVEGSQLSYNLQLNKPVKEARLIGKEQTLTLPAQTNAAVQLTNFALARSDRYKLELVDAEGRTNRIPAEFVVQVLPNRLPEVKLIFPRGDQRVSALEEMQLQAEASDDFGLLKHGLSFNRAGEDPQFIEVGQSAPANAKQQMQHLLAFESLKAQEDELVSYFAWAEDYGPDGEVRRTFSDMFFAEVRPFDEIFRRDESGEGAEQSQQQGQGGEEATQLAELQKQIIIATWKLQRGGKGQTNFVADTQTVLESQEKALEQVEEMAGRADDPRIQGIITAAQKDMERAINQLGTAANDRSDTPLPNAISAEQSAYQSLLRLQPRETRVARSRSQQGGGGGQQRNQRQLDQLEMADEDRRYETERQAQAQPNQEQREQLQMLNRLKELAQRQQDFNDRLQELQTALQAARTEEEKEDIRRELKRLRDEERQMLADIDELRQRMEQSPNASQSAEARQQLDQTRENVNRAAEALEQESVSQALAAGTRAQENLQQLREDFRRETSSQFSDQMREMRNQARELSSQQEQIAKGIEGLGQGQRKSLTDTDERQELAERLAQQRSAMTNLVTNMRQVTEQAEASEPLLSRQLYDTLRRSDQMNGENMLELGSQLVERGFLPQAAEAERAARENIETLKQGVERAAESVLGNESESLRYAQEQLDELTNQVQREAAGAGNGQSQRDTNAVAGANGQRPSSALGQAGENSQRLAQGGDRGSQSPAGQPNSQGQQPGEQAGNQPGKNGQTGEQQTAQAGGQQGGQPSGQSQGQQPGESQNQSGQTQANATGGNSPSQNQPNANGQGQGQRNGQQRGGQTGGGGEEGGLENLRQLAEQFGSGPRDQGGPITGGDFVNWSDRLREVEEMLESPALRGEVARVRERVAAMRAEFRRHSKEPEWEIVQSQVVEPLAQVRTWLQQELARKQGADSLVPLDRDPVPGRYSELVRRYYEKLGSEQ